MGRKRQDKVPWPGGGIDRGAERQAAGPSTIPLATHDAVPPSTNPPPHSVTGVESGCSLSRPVLCVKASGRYQGTGQLASLGLRRREAVIGRAPPPQDCAHRRVKEWEGRRKAREGCHCQGAQAAKHQPRRRPVRHQWATAQHRALHAKPHRNAGSRCSAGGRTGHTQASTPSQDEGSSIQHPASSIRIHDLIHDGRVGPTVHHPILNLRCTALAQTRPGVGRGWCARSFEVSGEHLALWEWVQWAGRWGLR